MSRPFWYWAVSASMLALAGNVQASAVITVGPAGLYRTVQAGLTRAVALADPGTIQLRVQQGAFVENIEVPSACCVGAIVISGGWNTTFTARSGDPELTLLDGGARGRTLSFSSIASGALVLQNLTLTNGLLTPAAGGLPALGAGLYGSVSSTGSLGLASVHVRSNLIQATGAGAFEGQGGGAFVLLNGSGRLTITDSIFENNTIVESGGARVNSHGGGLELQVFGGSATVRRTLFRGNVAGGSDVAVGGGLSMLVQRLAGLGATFEDDHFEQNSVAPGGDAAGADFWAGDGHGSPNIVVRRCWFANNRDGYEQLRLASVRGARIDASDTLVYGGDQGGVHVFGNEAGYANLTNLTVADNAGLGIDAQAPYGKVSVFNTIAFGNGRDLSLSGMAFAGRNLVGVDPLFVDGAAGNYHLRSDSPARDAGAAAPPGPLGPFDIYGGPRVVGAAVDIGSDEID